MIDPVAIQIAVQIVRDDLAKILTSYTRICFPVAQATIDPLYFTSFEIAYSTVERV